LTPKLLGEQHSSQVHIQETKNALQIWMSK
jgi:hypothetical protein